MRKPWADLPLFRKADKLLGMFKALEKRVEALEENSLVLQERKAGEFTWHEVVSKNGQVTINLKTGTIQQNKKCLCERNTDEHQEA